MASATRRKGNKKKKAKRGTNIESLATTISKIVSSTGEVNFGSWGEGSLCYKICLEQNRKSSQTILKNFWYVWHTNREGIRTIVERKLKQIANETPGNSDLGINGYGHLECAMATSPLRNDMGNVNKKNISLEVALPQNAPSFPDALHCTPKASPLTVKSILTATRSSTQIDIEDEHIDKDNCGNYPEKMENSDTLSLLSEDVAELNGQSSPVAAQILEESVIKEMSDTNSNLYTNIFENPESINTSSLRSGRVQDLTLYYHNNRMESENESQSDETHRMQSRLKEEDFSTVDKNNPDELSNDHTLSHRSEHVGNAWNGTETHSEVQSSIRSRVGGKANSSLSDEHDFDAETDSSNDFQQNTRIDVSLVQLDSDGRIITRELDTPARLPPPQKNNDQFHFVSKQFLIESEMFYRTTGGQIIYDQSKKKFVACYTNKRQEDLLNYDAIRCFMKTLVKNGLNLRGCVLSYYGNVRENLMTVVTYARCKYSSHNQRFKFEMTNIHQAVATISVYVTEHKGDIIHDGLPIMEQLRGAERDDIKRIVSQTNPMEHYDEVIKNTDINQIRDGDYGKVRNLPVFRQLKAETKKGLKRYITSMDVSDMMQRYKEDQMVADPYIRRVGEPFHVHLFSREQLNTVTRNDKIVFFDSTGSVVRKPDDNLNTKKCEPSLYKRIFYYAMVILKKHMQEKTLTQNTNTENDSNNAQVKVKPGIQIPLIEMVTCEQDIASISLLLAKYKIYIHSEKLKWPLFRVVVVDWSWPLINAILKEWTGMAIGMYLRMAYNVVSGNGSLPSDIVAIQNCCAHFQNRVSKTISRKFSKYADIKTVILEATGIMLQCQTLKDLDMAYENFMILLQSKSRTEAQNAMTQLNNLQVDEPDKEKDYADIDDDADKNDEDDDVDELELIEDGEEHGAIFAESPFYRRYFAKLIKIEESVATEECDDDLNEYYAPEIAKYVTKTYMPYAPIWSGLLLSKLLPGTRKLSNAPIEGYFRILKHDVLKCQTGLGIGEFVEITRNYKSRTCTRSEVQEILQRERPITKQKLRLLRGPGNPLAEENWKDKKKGKTRGPNHLGAPTIKRYSKEQRLALSPVSSVPDPIKNGCSGVRSEITEAAKKRTYDWIQISNDTQPAKKSRMSTKCLTMSESASYREIVNCDSTELSVAIPRLEETFISQSTISSINSIHRNALKNSLFLDPFYYMQEIVIPEEIATINNDEDEQGTAIVAGRKNGKGNKKKIKEEIKKMEMTKKVELFYYIGQYWCNDTTRIIGSACMNLCSEDYLSLKGSRYINGSVIDCFAIGKFSIGKWNNVTYVPTITTMYLFGDNSKGEKLKRGPQWSMYHIKTPVKGIVLLPYTWKLHWRLIVLNVDNRTIHVLDPINMKANDRNRAASEFKKYLAECKRRKDYDTNNLCDIEWTVSNSTEKRPLQKDGYNCGLYVMYYLNCLATGRSMESDNFDPVCFREQFARELLEMSHSMHYVCYLCAGDSNEWSVQCEICKRWTHMKCIQLCEKNETDYLIDKTAVYICMLCQNADRPWMKD